MSDVLTFPDAMLDLRSWLRAHPLLANLTAEQVWFRLPVENPTNAPFMRISRVGGGPQPGEAAKEQLRVSHEIWGLQDSDYMVVRQTLIALESIYRYAQNVLMGTDTVLENALVTGGMDAPDPDTGWPRIVVTAELTVSLP